MAKIFKNVDKIITSSGTEVDLENIQASGGSAGGGGGTTLSDVGITFDVQAGDNVWEVDATPSTTAFSVAKSEDGDGSINFDFPVNPNP